MIAEILERRLPALRIPAWDGRWRAAPAPRRCRLYCVGAAKSGTHSIAELFGPGVRAQHEPEARRTIRLILDHDAGELRAGELARELRRRDARLGLEVESSHLLLSLVPTLLHEFPDARFVVTVRDAWSWLDSLINDTLRRDVQPFWHDYRRHRFGPLTGHPPQEEPLARRGLHTLDGYLAYWARHNEQVLAAVPPARRLVLRTAEITPRIRDIAAFAGLPATAVRPQGAHAFANPVKHRILHELDRPYLDAAVERRCGPLMRRFFPEIRTLEDALP